MTKNRVMYISGTQANYLLFALDKFCKTDSNGNVQINTIPEYSLKEIQELRDALFLNHEHPGEK